MFNQAFLTALDALCAQHNIARNVSGSQITLIDNGPNNEGRQSLRFYGRHYGLTEDDYGTEFMSNGTRFKLVGVKPSRPKYPLSCQHPDGRVFKFTTGPVSQIVAKRQVKPAPIAQDQAAAAPTPTTVLNPPPAAAIPGLEALAQF